MTRSRELEIANLMTREALTPVRMPTTITPRWRQVFWRVEPYLSDDERGIVSAACEAYLGVSDASV